MSDDSAAVVVQAPSSVEADYDAIAAAVMETRRGRWFLAEFARRNRGADTRILLVAIERLEATMRGEPQASTDGRFHAALLEMAEAVARAGSNSSKPDSQQDGKGLQALLPVNAPENASRTIRASIESLKDITWRLRESDYDKTLCDAIDQDADGILSACDALDRAGRETTDLRRLLDDLTGLIDTALGLSSDRRTDDPPAEAAMQDDADAHDPSFAAQPPPTIEDRTERMWEEAIGDLPSPELTGNPAAELSADLEILSEQSAPVEAAATPEKPGETEADKEGRFTRQMSAEDRDAFVQAEEMEFALRAQAQSRTGAGASQASCGDPPIQHRDLLAGMSEEEKIALFT